ncbi:DNA-binding response OmpR family regulator [Cytobacillus purgationiresistens]|uniref:DNA-binding response OmpR family regulator n=1 Tax=Cytobacillus purgationiresistens TaxID=863449 RepID=A0ABU0AR97_9BACI|nr:DNA-binding response OmpR family regulator [Cytobacillus purgationiresistens]
MMQPKILIIDDDKEIRNLIGIYLENEGLERLHLSGQKY